MATAEVETGAGAAAGEVAPVPTETGVLSLNTSKPPEPAGDASEVAREERRQKRALLASLVFIMTSVVGQR